MDFARNERGFCVGFAWNLILFSFVREREGYKHHADCTVIENYSLALTYFKQCYNKMKLCQKFIFFLSDFMTALFMVPLFLLSI